jgi:hypothetical protein
MDVVRAADLVSGELSRARQRLSPALLSGDEETLAQLLRMQAEAADLALGALHFEPQRRDGFIQEVALELVVHGAYYDLPIFVDGLFRQRHAVEIHRLTIEAEAAGTALVTSRIEARLFRPVEVPRAQLEGSIDSAELSASERGFATSAIAAAAQLEALERFIELLPGIQERSQANRRLVLRTIPRLVRKLPGSPMDWVGATFEGEQVKLAME